MTARQPKAFVLTPDEVNALDVASQKFAQWKRDWHDDGAAFNSGEMAALRKAARAFHKALAPLLGQDAIGTRARLLCRMQELQLFQHSQAHYYDEMRRAMFTAMIVDDACGRDVQRGVKADGLAYTWIFHVADEWPGDPPTGGNRFGQALLGYRQADVPAVGSAERVETALMLWRKQRHG